MFLVHLFAVKAYYWRPTKEQFREAIEYVVETSPAYPDSIVTSSGKRDHYLNYYLARFGFPAQASSVNDGKDLRRLRAADEIRFVWFVEPSRPEPIDRSSLARGGVRVVERRKFHKMDVWLFAVPPAPGAP
jgi:hypothetical protein